MVGAGVNTCVLSTLRKKATLLAEHLHIWIACLVVG